MLFSERETSCNELRQQIDILINTPEFSVEQLTLLVAQLEDHLTRPIPADVSNDVYADFLQQNLNWLQVAMATLSEQKNNMAADMLRLKRGKQANICYRQ